MHIQTKNWLVYFLAAIFVLGPYPFPVYIIFIAFYHKMYKSKEANFGNINYYFPQVHSFPAKSTTQLSAVSLSDKIKSCVNI